MPKGLPSVVAGPALSQDRAFSSPASPAPVSRRSAGRTKPGALLALAALGLSLLTGCFALRPSNGGGQTASLPGRTVRAADVALPRGYRLEVVATGFTFPTAVAFDEAGRAYVLEAGYSYGEVFTIPRLLRLEQDGSRHEVARGEHAPWNGLDYAGGAFYIAQGGEVGGGRIIKVTPDGQITPLVQNLPSLGDHHTNRPVVGRDGYVYFGQGTATNSGVVGEDNADFGWLKRHPQFHDVPCQDITLAGRNYQSGNPLAPERGPVVTGAFLPFGTPSAPGQVVPGALPCSGAILRVPIAGGPLELVAWGLRNPFGLAWSPDGALYVAENSYDVRGSRPVFGAGDPLWRVTPGTWYGWPDYHAGRPLTDADHFTAPGRPPPGQLLARHPNAPPRPAALLGVHSSSNGLDFSRSARFGYVNEAFVAQFGDLAPGVGKVSGPVGYKIVRVNVESGRVEDFAVNRGDTNGPASKIGGGGFERPLDARFNPAGDALYIVDFGIMTTTEKGPVPRPGTGVLWRVVREGES
ncbi:PQQ-dependent sugar dehydrogenase [Deinococcus peraridilitoris]|uniref:Glucose/sorbosone dehydrogenase n=1 Tax=Deinococcus peraridilitoris (strain DSM 19664 / LMG 22246 / CIP 109416 / KR-200) TaxID=937777 RepID=L0A3J1_DEIPD|nr:PQQ-dependent sugar dehydrogenase [Deinococcus peraridilitoris]AFZ68004.1 hypothetical protein Deipe_2539 [Deinococcus peraridilitoris DSM 19664]